MVLADGLMTTVAFELIPFVIPEKDVTPPGFDGGGPIDVTTNRNVRYRSMFPKWLRTLTPLTFTGVVDPDWIPPIEAVVNVNQIVDVNFPDGFILEFFGYIDKFVPGSHKESEQPTYVFTVQPTCLDHQGNEVVPVFIAGTESAAWPAGARRVGP